MVKAIGKVGVYQYDGAHPFISNHQAFNGHLHKASIVKNAVEFIAQRCRQTGKQWTEMLSRKEWGLTQGLKHRLETGRNGKQRMRESFTVKTASELSLESWQDVTSTGFQDLSFAPSARLISDFLEQQDQEQQWLKQEVAHSPEGRARLTFETSANVSAAEEVDQLKIREPSQRLAAQVILVVSPTLRQRKPPCWLPRARKTNCNHIALFHSVDCIYQP